jgi:hypothetical protein
MSNFEHDYVEFDERGFKCLRCQCCGTIIADWIPIERALNTDPPQKITAWAFVRLSNFRTARVVLEDTSVADVKLCAGCEHEDFDHEKDPLRTESIVQQWARAETLHLEWMGAAKPQIEEASAKWDEMRAFKKIPKLSDQATKELAISVVNEVLVKEAAAVEELNAELDGGKI